MTTSTQRSFSLTTKICAAATALVVISLGVTAAVTGIKSSSTAEAASMQTARGSARQAANMVGGRITASLATVASLASMARATTPGDAPMSRAQINKVISAAALESADLMGVGINWEPNAFDGKDAEFAGKKPEYDDTGRFVPYYAKDGKGGVTVEPAVFTGAPGADDWYLIPRKTGRTHFTDPYVYKVNGVDVLMASLVVPIMIDGAFKGATNGDFKISEMAGILAQVKTLDGGQLSLVSNGGLYASNPNRALDGKKADDIPAAGLAAIREGKVFEYDSADGKVHLLQPLLLHPEIGPWAVRLSFPRSVATADARSVLTYTLMVSVLCAVVAALVLVALLSRLMLPLRRLSEAMTDLSSGNADLSVRLATKGNDELAAIGNGFNAFVGKINSVLERVAHSSASVATASTEISQGNNDLSSRTEQQASALEETAASMEELTSTVRQNADNARQANQLAASASSVAVRGGEVVAQVVDTMASINESSRKVVDIIGVIDSIAFQTNILALNAAVEAARAGEQGRGFAVVASEVRNLAQRSAAAAKEIKGLITDSVDKVEQGSRLVADAGTTMDEVVTSVRQVTDIVSEIAAASGEQSAGIGQVNQAIVQMDGATQQNAALVEQAAAAAESLHEQADTLVALVGEFKLSNTAGAPAARVAAPRAPTAPAQSLAPLPAALPAPRAARPGPRPAPTRPAPKSVPATQQADEWETF